MSKITPDNITRGQAKKIVRLLSQWARADVMSRMGRFDNLEYIDYAMVKLDREADIRRLLFGTDCIAELATRWGMIRKMDRLRKVKKENMFEKKRRKSK